jgi:uncharacterized membrane protein
MEFILVVIALVWLYLLSKRVSILEARERGAEKAAEGVRTLTGVEQAALTASSRRLDGEGELIPPSPPSVVIHPDSSTDPVAHFVEWIQKDFMMKVGAFLLLCAVGLFVSYAFANNWIGETGRIVLGLLLGVGILSLATWRIRTHAHQGGIFAVLGAATIVLTLYAAREAYDMFTPVTALALMFFSVVFVAFLAVQHESQNLALSALIIGSLAPQFTAVPAPDMIMNFTFLAVIVVGTLWVVKLKSWDMLSLVALAVVWLYSSPYLSPYYGNGERDIALLFTFFFTGLFFFANILGLIRQEGVHKEWLHTVTAVGTSLYLITWIQAVGAPSWQSMLYLMWMLVFTVGSFLVYRLFSSSTAFYIYGGTSIALLGAATLAEFEGTRLTLVYIIEIATLVLLTLAVLRNVRLASLLSILFVFPIALSGENIASSAWSTGVLHEDFFVLLFLGGILAFVGHKLMHLEESSEQGAFTMGKVLLVLASLYGLSLISLILHAPNVIGGQNATIVTLIIYTVIGLMLNVMGTRREIRTLRIGGAVLLGAVVLRLLLVEVGMMETTGRIITFGAIGALLLSTAFIRKTSKSDVTQTTL